MAERRVTKGKIKVFSNTTEPGLAGQLRRVADWRYRKPVELAGAAWRTAARRRDPYRLLPFPQAVHIEITNKCNIACVMCPQPTQPREQGMMSEDLFRRIIDELRRPPAAPGKRRHHGPRRTDAPSRFRKIRAHRERSPYSESLLQHQRHRPHGKTRAHPRRRPGARPPHHQPRRRDERNVRKPSASAPISNASWTTPAASWRSNANSARGVPS
ncbi:MAG: hypothetical protein M5R36_29260 [Deltaproteobacteria bacterium]|nr:hypothetical protein [Deltaproteobacteria bacterium]